MLFIFHFTCDSAIPVVQYSEYNGMNKSGNTCKLIPSAIKLLFSKGVEVLKSYPRNTKFITSKSKLQTSRTDMRVRVRVRVCVWTLLQAIYDGKIAYYHPFPLSKTIL
jgi:hypothetical protein